MSTGICTDAATLLGMFALKTKALVSFETSVTIHQATSLTSQKT